jgi:hypothetical protein
MRSPDVWTFNYHREPVVRAVPHHDRVGAQFYRQGCGHLARRQRRSATLWDGDSGHPR